MSIPLTVGQAGPFCQSCGLPLYQPADFGTGDAGVRVNDYCIFCFRDGAFTEPGLSKKMMVERCIEILVRRHVMAESDARSHVRQSMSRLKRWRLRRSPARRDARIDAPGTGSG